ARVEPELPAEARLRDRPCRHERRARDNPASGIDDQLADAASALHRQVEGGRRDHALDERLVGPYGARQSLLRDEWDGGLAVADAGAEVDPPGLDQPHRPVAGDAPAEKRREVVIALRAIRASEHRRVQGYTVPPDRRNLAPAGRRRVSGLHAVEP